MQPRNRAKGTKTPDSFKRSEKPPVPEGVEKIRDAEDFDTIIDLPAGRFHADENSFPGIWVITREFAQSFEVG